MIEKINTIFWTNSPFTYPPTPNTIPKGLGHGRKTRKEYIQFLYISQGSLKELETHLMLSKRVGLSPSDVIDSLLNQCESVGRLLSALIRVLESRS